MLNPKDSGEPVRIIRFEEGCIQLDQKALEKILLDDRVKEKHVAVVALAGDFRKGKSFMLSFFLRFLYNLGNHVWLGGPNDPLHGFGWSSGCNRDTTGILVWNDVFLVKTPQDKELAVLLMDTQGMHDDKSTVQESATIFALTTMVSSVLVYNISQNIQENDLQYLHLFTEYGRLAQVDQSVGKPFQKLLFLVRDWYHLCDAEFGARGGRKLLEQRLRVSDNQHPQLQEVRKHIHTSFTEVDCFLMPHPGLKVAQDISFDGRLSDIEKDFKEQLLHLVPSLLAPEKLIPKRMNGHKITCKELYIYMMIYGNMFQGNTLPELTTVFQANAKADHLNAMLKALEQYETRMKELRGGPKKSRKKLDEIHQRECERARETFAKTRKMGGEELSKLYLKELSKRMDNWYLDFATGMTKTPILGTTYCQAATGPAAIGFAAGATVCIVIGMPIHGACCVAAAVLAAGVFISSLIYDCCVNVSSTNSQATQEQVYKVSSMELRGERQYFQSTPLDVDLLQQCVERTSNANKVTWMLEAMVRAKDSYLASMEEICGGDKPYVSPEQLEEHHYRCREAALKMLAGDYEAAETTQSSLHGLDEVIEKAFEDFSIQNARKMSFGSRIMSWLGDKVKRSSAPYCRLKES